MHCIFYIIFTALTSLLLFNVLPAVGQNEENQKIWTGIRKDGTVISKIELGKIIYEHQKWLETSGKEGKRANLYGANLNGADLSATDLRGANLHGASLFRANLSGANLFKADLSNADLSRAELSNAHLFESNLSGAKFWYSNVSGVIFVVKPNSLPYIPSIATATGLSKLSYTTSTHALLELRKAFKDAGLLTQERKITYAIKHTQRRELWNRKNVWDKFESLFYYIFFEWTCSYGMRPGRPLLLLFLAIIPLFSIPYSVVLKWPPKSEGIWKVWIPGRVRKYLGSEDPVRLKLKSFSAIAFGFYFSVISAFSIGWRELNVGNWITRIQRREYTLRASGWVRTVSGVQSLISVYLLALWVLTYFGRPFEAI